MSLFHAPLTLFVAAPPVPAAILTSVSDAAFTQEVAAVRADVYALHAALDAVPTNHRLRLILADRLDELRDPTAEGYRALGRLGRSPDGNGWWNAYQQDEAGAEAAHLPADWWALVHDIRHPSRRAAEDAAARAFALLPESRRAELLAGSARV